MNNGSDNADPVQRSLKVSISDQKQHLKVFPGQAAITGRWPSGPSVSLGPTIKRPIEYISCHRFVESLSSWWRVDRRVVERRLMDKMTSIRGECLASADIRKGSTYSTYCPIRYAEVPRPKPWATVIPRRSLLP